MTENATQAEVSQRLDLVSDLVIKGMAQREIVRYIRDKHDSFGGLTDRQLRTYVHKAKERLAGQAKKVDRSEQFAIALERNNLVFNAAYRIQDYRTALTANVENIKLMRLNQPSAAWSWEEAAKQAGIDPKDVMAQFIQTLDMEGVEEGDHEA